MKNLIFTLALMAVLWSCKFEQDIVFREIDNVVVQNIVDGKVNLTADAEFFNPNDISGKLKAINLVISLEDRELARITQTNSFKIEKESNFTIPIEVQFSMEEVQSSLLSNILNIVRGNKIRLHFKGDIKVSTWGVTQKVPVDYYQEVKL